REPVQRPARCARRNGEIVCAARAAASERRGDCGTLEAGRHPQGGDIVTERGRSRDAGDPCWMSAGALTACYAARTLSPVEATRATLARIDALDPRINAYCLVDHEAAMAAARASEARWMQG